MKTLLRGSSALFLSVLLAVSARAADEFFAVLSADETPYREAYEGFVEAIGRKVPATVLTKRRPAIPAGTRVVVTFGGEAAALAYPDDAAVIVCLAPGVGPNGLAHRGPATFVEMAPSPERLLGELKTLQPALGRLGVFFASPASQPYVDALRAAGAAAGVKVVVERLAGAQELPDRLRKLYGQVEALWIPPDPRLITKQVFEIIKDFSWSNDVPFYSPTHGLVALGGVASAAASYREVGRTAADPAARALAGGKIPSVVYPAPQTAVNRSSAEQAGLAIPEEVLQRVKRLYP